MFSAELQPVLQFSLQEEEPRAVGLVQEEELLAVGLDQEEEPRADGIDREEEPRAEGFDQEQEPRAEEVDRQLGQLTKTRAEQLSLGGPCCIIGQITQFKPLCKCEVLTLCKSLDFRRLVCILGSCWVADLS